MSRSCSPFVRKTFQLVNDKSTDEIVSWSNHGKSFTIWDSCAFEVEILPLYFKHNNICSFIRQLNTYGFHKQNNRSADHHGQEFVHPEFYQTTKNLSLINRKSKPQHKTPLVSNQVQTQNAPVVTPVVAGNPNLFQTLKCLTAKQEESERMLASILSELETTRTIINKLQANSPVSSPISSPDCYSTCGFKRSFNESSCNAYPTTDSYPVEKKFKTEKGFSVRRIPQSFEELFDDLTVPNQSYTQSNYLGFSCAVPEENAFDLNSLLLDC